MLLSCRVKKGVRRFGDSFPEERRRVAFYCDRLKVLGAPGCLGPRDTWLRQLARSESWESWRSLIKQGHSCGSHR